MDETKVLESTEFSWNELKRLIDLIPQTDPTTSSYGILLESIERYGAIMKFVDWFLTVRKLTINEPKEEVKPEEEPVSDNIIQFNPPVAEAEKFETDVSDEDTSAEEVAIIEYDPAKVKSLIVKARSEKKIASVSSWITENFGVSGFNAIPAAKYPEVMEKLQELGVI